MSVGKNTIRNGHLKQEKARKCKQYYQIHEKSPEIHQENRLKSMKNLPKSMENRPKSMKNRWKSMPGAFQAAKKATFPIF